MSVCYSGYSFPCPDARLADEDILFFALSPTGIAAIIIVGAVSVGTLAFEQSALMTIMFGVANDRHIGIRQVLRLTTTRALPILHVTGKLINIVLLITAPFLVTAGFVYRALLTEFDINYYLHERPPEFLLAVGIAAILVLVWLIVMIPFLAARLMALPLVLFESVPANESLSRSYRRTANQRLRIAFWLAFWAIGNLVFSFASTAAVVWIGRVALTPSLGSLHWIVLAAGSILGLWLAVNYLTTLVAVTTLAFAALVEPLPQPFYERLSIGARLSHATQ